MIAALSLLSYTLLTPGALPIELPAQFLAGGHQLAACVHNSRRGTIRAGWDLNPHPRAVDRRGLEPRTSCLQGRRSPSWS
jgi:hypothetical protein